MFTCDFLTRMIFSEGDSDHSDEDTPASTVRLKRGFLSATAETRADLSSDSENIDLLEQGI